MKYRIPIRNATPGVGRLAPRLGAATIVFAWAVHAVLERSTPTAGESLVAAPTEIRLTFSGPVEEAGAVMRLLGPAGAVWTLDARHADGEARTLVGTPPPLEPGGYRVEWRVVSADGHAVGDDFTFVVTGGAPGESMTPPPPSEGVGGGGAGGARASPTEGSLLVATRMGRNLALLTVAGLLLFAARGSGAPTPTLRATSVALALAAPVLASAHAWLWASAALTGASGSADAVTALTGTTTGRALGAEAILAWLVPWALLLARRTGLAAAFAALAIGVGGFGGHAASFTPTWAVPANVIHQLAAATWIGGLAYLVTQRTATDFAAAARRVSAAALAAALLVTVTGVIQSWLFLDSPARILSSMFGLLLLGKAAGLAALVAFGAYHRFRLLPGVEHPQGPARLAGSVRLELALAAAVLLLAAVLSHTSPTS